MEILEVTPRELEVYGKIPIRFWVQERWTEAGFVPVSEPWEKDYDAPGNRPVDWPSQFDLLNWGLFLAREDARVLGAAAVCWSTPGVDLLVGRTDLAFVWDIRVDPDVRGQGVGQQLWQHCENWCLARGVGELRVETQDVNAPACQFYARMGCELLKVTPGIYADLPDEVQLIWGRRLDV